VLNFALVQAARGVAVTRGENAGRTLAHANVVRAFESAAITGVRGTHELVLPEGVRAEQASVVVYAQSESTLHVLGATSVSLG
jgi:hypothetical protein